MSGPDESLAEYLRSAPGGPLRAVTCDLWFTLITLRPSEKRRWEAARRNVWFDALAPRHDSAAFRAAWDTMRRWIRQREWAGRAPGLAAQCDWLGERLGSTVDREGIDEGLTLALRSVDVRWVPGAREALQALAGEGIPIGLVSNIVNEPSPAAHALVAGLGIEALAGSVQLSCDLPSSKPDPLPYLRCLAELGVPPASAVHVGDHALDGIGARRAGLLPLRFTGGRPGPPRPGAPAGPRGGKGTPSVGTWSELLAAWPMFHS
jgi:FMN phosphatase YigB (HAD superfamily)